MKRSEIETQYQEKKSEIDSRLEEFRDLRDAPEERKFLELVFVILTSQTEAEKAWDAAEELDRQGLLEEPEPEEIQQVLESHGVQYAEEKAGYVVENRKNLSQPTLADPEKKLKISDRIDAEDLESSREWLVENVKGISWKGASHFLRNVGYGNGFAIISSHITAVMEELGITGDAENPANRDQYLEMEERLRKFSDGIGIDIQALDLVLWSMRTGEVFK